MKNNKKLKNKEHLILAVGVFKKRMWPWLFVILAAVITAVCYTLIAVEYFFGTRVCADCTTYFTYTRHYCQYVNFTLIVAAALVVLAILCAIIFLRKRTLTISTTAITFKKGRKTIQIPLSTIESIDTGASSVLVTVPFKKFKFAGLENKKEVYDALLLQLSAPSETVVQSVTSTPSLTAMAAPLLSNPTLQGKLVYFKKLLDFGLITEAQYNNYINLSLKADSLEKD